MVITLFGSQDNHPLMRKLSMEFILQRRSIHCTKERIMTPEYNY